MVAELNEKHKAVVDLCDDDSDDSDIEFIRICEKTVLHPRPTMKPRLMKKPNRACSPPVPDPLTGPSTQPDIKFAPKQSRQHDFNEWLVYVRIQNQRIAAEFQRSAALEQEAIFRAASLRMAKEIASLRERNERERFTEIKKRNSEQQVWSDLCRNVNIAVDIGDGIPNPFDNNPYICLGLKNNASFSEVKTRYRKLVLCFHPDKNKHPEAKSVFCAFAEAYDKLTKK